MSKELIQQ